MKSEEDLVFDDDINDNVNWVQMLHNDKRFSKVAMHLNYKKQSGTLLIKISLCFIIH